jgi:hypothetical protein
MANYLYPSISEREAFYRQKAQEYGIDPGIAIKVAKSEGMQPGVFQSNVYKNGRRENSWGDWQLYKDGGLGNKFMDQTGLDPADPKNWKEAGDFALKTAAQKKSWGDWYGAGRVGIAKNQGFNSPMSLGPSAEAAPTMSGIPPMNVPQPQFPGLDLNGAIDPRKLTPLQLAMLQAQGAGPMGPGSTPGLGAPNPMQLAMGQGDPSMMDPMANPSNAPMNPGQGTMPVPPMAEAMRVGPAGAGGPIMDMAEDGPGASAPKGNWFQRNGEKIGDAMMGAGAALQSIDNPQGAAALIGLLRTKKDGKLTAEDLIRLSQGERRLAQGDRSLDIKDAAAKAKLEEKERPKQEARASMSGYVKDMANRYVKLDELGGIVNPDKPQKDNAKAWMAGTQVGQGVGKMMGTEAQSIREGINNVRPMLMNAIRQATNAGVRSFDSDKELQFYMSAVSDPGTGDLYSNLAALERLDEHFGLGMGLKETLPPELYARVKGQAENYKTAKPWDSGASTTPSTDKVIDFDDWKRGG